MTVLIIQHLEPVLGYFKNLLWLCPDCISLVTFWMGHLGEIGGLQIDIYEYFHYHCLHTTSFIYCYL